MKYRICRDGLGRYVVQQYSGGRWVDASYWNGDNNCLVVFRRQASAARWIKRKQDSQALAAKAAERTPITAPVAGNTNNQPTKDN